LRGDGCGCGDDFDGANGCADGESDAPLRLPVVLPLIAADGAECDGSGVIGRKH